MSEGRAGTVHRFTNVELRGLHGSLVETIPAKPGIFVLIGEAGVGKTVLLAGLAAELRAAGCLVIQQSPPPVSLAELASLVATAIGITEIQTDDVHAIAAIKRRMVERVHLHRRIVLVVDDAQEIGTEALLGLGALVSANDGVSAECSVVLAGRPDFAARVDAPLFRSLKDRIVIIRRIERMEQDAIRCLVWSRLRFLGWEVAQTFTEEAVAAIAQAADGLPRDALRLTESAVRVAIETGQHVTGRLVAGLVDRSSLPASPPSTPQQAAGRGAEQRPLPQRRGSARLALAGGAIAVASFAALGTGMTGTGRLYGPPESLLPALAEHAGTSRDSLERQAGPEPASRLLYSDAPAPRIIETRHESLAALLETRDTIASRDAGATRDAGASWDAAASSAHSATLLYDGARERMRGFVLHAAQLPDADMPAPAEENVRRDTDSMPSPSDEDGADATPSQSNAHAAPPTHAVPASSEGADARSGRAPSAEGKSATVEQSAAASDPPASLDAGPHDGAAPAEGPIDVGDRAAEGQDSPAIPMEHAAAPADAQGPAEAPAPAEAPRAPTRTREVTGAVPDPRLDRQPSADDRMPSASPAVLTAGPGAEPSPSPELVQLLMRRGNDMIDIGDVSAARLLFERAAASGDAAAATAAAKTYDPLFLRELGARGLQPSAERAREWYRKARDAGDREATMRLQRLDAFLQAEQPGRPAQADTRRRE